MLIRRLRRFLSESLESEEWLLDRKNDSYLNIINPQRHIYAEEYDLKKLDDISLNTTFQKPPGLQHNLSQIVRTEGIYPSSQFSPFIQTIPEITESLYKRFSNYTVYLRPYDKAADFAISKRLGRRFYDLFVFF